MTAPVREVRPDVATRAWTSCDPGAIIRRFGGGLDAEFVSTPAATIEWFSHRGDVVLEHGAADQQAFGVFGPRHGEFFVGGLRVGARSVVADDPEPRAHRLTGRNDAAVAIPQGEVADVGGRTLIDLEASSAQYERSATSSAQTRCLARSEGSSPAALAAGLGAFPPGQLASSCRRSFGECPSETGRRTPFDPSAPDLDDVHGDPLRRHRSWVV